MVCSFKGMIYCMITVFVWLQMMVFSSTVFAATNDANSIQLIPVWNSGTIVWAYKTLTSSGSQHQFWDEYNKIAKSDDFDASKPKWLANQLSSGIMTWDTIIAYSWVIIKFISNLGLVVGAFFIILSGYQYAMSSFGTKEDNGSAIKNAFIGIAVIATSYGIFRLLARIFIE